MRRLESRDGVALSLETRGEPDRPGIVFAHGFGQTRRAWAGSAATLAERGYFTVTYDARGHGDSGWRQEKPYDWEQMRRRSRRRRRRAAMRAPILVGASMGGLVGLAVEGMDRSACFARSCWWMSHRAGNLAASTAFHFHARASGWIRFARCEAAEAIAAYLPHRGERKSPQSHCARCSTRRTDGRLRWHWDPRLLDELVVSESEQPAALDGRARERSAFRRC